MATLVAGLTLGVAQQARGAHFMAHTLWTGWICWCIAVLLERARRRFAFAADAVPGAEY